MMYVTVNATKYRLQNVSKTSHPWRNSPDAFPYNRSGTATAPAPFLALLSALVSSPFARTSAAALVSSIIAAYRAFTSAVCFSLSPRDNSGFIIRPFTSAICFSMSSLNSLSRFSSSASGVAIPKSRPAPRATRPSDRSW